MILTNEELIFISEKLKVDKPQKIIIGGKTIIVTLSLTNFEGGCNELERTYIDNKGVKTRHVEGNLYATCNIMFEIFDKKY